MRVGLVAVLVVLVALSGVAGPVGAADAPESFDQPVSLSEVQQDFDRTEFRITVYANGSARWTFRYQQTLENETERGDFEAFAERFRTEETPLYTDFVNRSRSLTDSGSEATGREMSATAFRRDARVSELGNQGIVELSFRWDGFARVDGDQVVVGDVFDGGLYIRADQRLVFAHGPDLRFSEAAPAPDSFSGQVLSASGTVTWAGERSFNDGRPRVVLIPPSQTGGDGGATTAPGTGGDGGGAGSGGDGMGLLPVLGLLAVVVLGGVAAFAYRSGAFGGDGSATDDAGAAGAAGAAATDPEPEESDPEPAVPDEVLLSDEDRVMNLIEENGGRMKQVNIVEETGWSKSKVSMLLSDMEDDDLISKLRVGRENIISKKGMEPEAAKSPFEDEDG